MTSSDPPKPIRGKLTILFIFGLAAVAAGAAQWFSYQQTHRTQQHWGTPAALLIARAPLVETLRLGSEGAGTPPATIQVDGDILFVLADKNTSDIDKAPGILNVRHALRMDASFDWDATPEKCEPKWDYAMRFSDDEGQVTLLFALNCRLVRQLENGKQATLIESTTEGLKEFFGEQFPGEATKKDHKSS
jgi:hypothetical protein